METERGNWNPIRMNRGGPSISHLFFADDLLLFCTIGHEQVKLVHKLLKDFCSSSGHRVNAAKTKNLLFQECVLS